jgi:hypothetical protein
MYNNVGILILNDPVYGPLDLDGSVASLTWAIDRARTMEVSVKCSGLKTFAFKSCKKEI